MFEDWADDRFLRPQSWTHANCSWFCSCWVFLVFQFALGARRNGVYFGFFRAPSAAAGGVAAVAVVLWPYREPVERKRLHFHRFSGLGQQLAGVSDCFLGFSAQPGHAGFDLEFLHRHRSGPAGLAADRCQQQGRQT
jgi:hypothetical protein